MPKRSSSSSQTSKTSSDNPTTAIDPILKIAKKWAKEPTVKQKTKILTKEALHANITEIDGMSVSMLKTYMSKNDIDHLKRTVVLRAFNKRLLDEQYQELRSNAGLLRDLEESVNQWLSNLSQTSVCTLLKDGKSEEAKKVPWYNPDEVRDSELFVLELKSHKYAPRSGLDYGRSCAIPVNDEKKWKYEQYGTSDIRDDHRAPNTRVGAKTRDLLLPPANKISLIDRFINYEIHAPLNK